MKKIGKISINPEKLIKNEELVNLRGGGYFGLAYCNDENNNFLGTVVVRDCDNMVKECKEIYPLTTQGSCS
jgi:hypothetical protein